jgi:hypothetical protein
MRPICSKGKAIIPEKAFANDMFSTTKVIHISASNESKK